MAKQTQFHSSGQARPITFGVEIEAILAFRQQQLQSVLDRYYSHPPIIIKSFPDSAHSTFLQENDLSHTCRNLYPSWVLQVPAIAGIDKSLEVNGHQSTSITGKLGKVRRYLAEPLIIAKEALSNIDIPVDVVAQLRRNAETLLLEQANGAHEITLRAKSANYQRWTLTTDHTLIGHLERQLHAILGDRLFKYNTIADPDGTIRTEREKQWDSSGLELVSPVFQYSNKTSAFTTISECLHNLSNGADHTILTSKWASLQVHIGLDLQNGLNSPLPLLQHLAYILITHEDLLSKLHPRSRCGLSLKPQNKVTDSSPRSDQDSFSASECSSYDDDDVWSEFDPDAPLPPEPTPAERAAEDEAYLQANEELVSNTESNYTGFTTVNSNARYFSHITSSSSYPPTPQHVASHVFDPEMNLQDLICLLQKPSTNLQDADLGHRYRGYMYNFDNLLTTFLHDSGSWKQSKPTIEFRQHACSIDAEEVRRWVELCFALVQFAARMAQNQTQSETPTPTQEDAGWETENKKYASMGEWPCRSIEDLLGEQCLGINEVDVRYWQARYEQFKDDRPLEDEVDQDAF